MKKYKGKFIKGSREGYWEHYYEDGKIDLKGKYLNGFREGQWEHYFLNGKMSWRGNFKNGDVTGYWENYDNYRKGILISKGFYL